MALRFVSGHESVVLRVVLEDSGGCSSLSKTREDVRWADVVAGRGRLVLASWVSVRLLWSVEKGRRGFGGCRGF